jgi:GT2 family glycosyltransferase
LLVVDNGSSDATPRVLAGFAASFRGTVRTLVEAKPGLARARNTGWIAAAGHIVVFTDDDCYPQPDYVDQILACFDEKPVAFIGGRVLLHDPEDAPITIQLLDRRIDLPAHSFVAPGLIHGANFAFRREALQAIGGFDERLGAGTKLFSAEDTDALARASARGFSGAYDPRPVVYHHHRRRNSAEVQDMRKAYTIGGGAYWLKCSLNPRVGYKYFLRWPRAMYRVGFRGTAWYLLGAWRFIWAAKAR